MLEGLMQDRPLLISSLIEHANRVSSRRRDRLAHGRGPDPPLHVRRHPPPLEAGREGAAGARRRARRPHRHARVERLSAHGALLRRLRHGRRAAHDQPAPVPRADRVHRQPRRGPATSSSTSRSRRCVEKLAPKLKSVKGFVAMTDRAHMPASDDPEPPLLRGPGRRAGQRLRLARRSTSAPRRRCATRRARPGNPKGVLYSHRSTVLHSFGVVRGRRPRPRRRPSRRCCVVPMFHVNAWGMPYAGAMCGAKLVLPGPALDGKSVYELMKRREGDAGARRADRLADAASVTSTRPELDPKKDLCAQARRHRRLGGAARDERALRDAVRRLRRPRLGHDRDVAARHGLQPAAEAPRTARSSSGSTSRRSRDARSTASS